MATFRDKISLFYNNPWDFVDNLSLTFKGNNLNIFQKYKRTQKVALGIVAFSIVCWIVFGFDSTPLQFIHLLYGLPSYLMGSINFNEWISIYHQYYGKELHYSALVFYCGIYYLLSKHYEKFNIKASKNVCYAVALTLLSIAMFEFYWMCSFAYWQNQWWVITWQMPQTRILLQNTVFLVAGVIGTLYMYADSFVYGSQETIVQLWRFKLKGKEVLGKNYSFRWNWLSLTLIMLSIATAVFWWFYPWQVEHISLTLTDGTVWTNSQHFPQTLYTIKLNPFGGVNAGDWFYVENNLVHAVNTVVKFLWTFTIAYIGWIKEVKKI